MATKKSTARKSTPSKYGPRAAQKVAEEVRAMKRGELRSGRSKKKVTNRKQAIAIGLSEARREGAKVPPAPSRRGRHKAAPGKNSRAHLSE